MANSVQETNGDTSFRRLFGAIISMILTFGGIALLIIGALAKIEVATFYYVGAGLCGVGALVFLVISGLVTITDIKETIISKKAE